MPTTKVNPQKAETVSIIKDLLSSSKSVAVIDYTGLKVSQATALRQAIRKAGGQYLVTKNTLFKIACGKKDFKLEGLSGFVFSHTDEVSSIKAVADFAKRNQINLTFKLGFLSDKVLSASEVLELATLPDKTTLVSKLLGSVISPLYNLAYNLNWNISKLARTLDAVSKSKNI